ncbi:MAG: exopolyphosphatase [Flavobacteriaceae bacterium]|nr:exopolyphosphatase [Flavobacteriaceae bacterium]
MRISKYAAIDIGSNAVRLLVSNVIERKNKPTLFTKNTMVRVPIRLGQDTFTHGSIGMPNQQRMINAMFSFKKLMGVHGVSHYMACATSALREAKNGLQLAKRILKETEVSVEIIDGKREAEIIAMTDLYDVMKPHKSYLLVDVGGGSTELTVIDRDKTIASKSFKIGTVRLLNKMVTDKELSSFQKWIEKHTHKLERLSVVGSGGTINKVFKLSGVRMGKPISYILLSEYYEYLKQLTQKELIIDLRLNQDRADVIVLAVHIYLLAMKQSGANKIYVPKVGLADGMVKLLYKELH